MLSIDAYDHETPNATEAHYRARAVHELGPGEFSRSDWSTTDSAEWQDTAPLVWVKHPTSPSLNARFTLRSPATQGIQREARQGKFQPLGSSEAVVVTDTRGPESGSIRFRCDTDEEQAALRALIDALVPVLVQFRPEDHEPDRWLSLAEHTRERFFDQSWAEGTWHELPWVEVARPGGNLSE